MITLLTLATLAHAEVPFPEEDIRPARGAVQIEQTPWWPIAAGAATVATGLAVAGLLRRAGRAPTPREIALAELAEARAQIGTATPRELCITLSDIVRRYIEAQTDARAAHRTTEEFLDDLAAGECPALAPHREALGAFLSWCDLGKYAAWSLTEAQQVSMHEAAEAFVRTADLSEPSTAGAA